MNFFAEAKNIKIAYIVSILAGLLLPLAFAPFELRAFAVISPAMFFALLAVIPVNKSFKVGYLFGLGVFGFGISWIYNSVHEFGGANAFVAFLLTIGLIGAMALYFALMAWLSVRYLRSKDFSISFMLVLLPIAWFGMEMFRSWFLTGFPWLLLGYSQVDTYLAGYIPVIGVMATSVPITIMAGGLASVVIGFQSQRIICLAAAGLVYLLAVLLYPMEWTETTGASKKVTIVQGSVPQNIKMDPTKINVSLDTYLNLTAAIDDTDVIIWPETAVPDFYIRQLSFLDYVKPIIADKGAVLITGIFNYNRDAAQSYNSLMLLDPANKGIDDTQFYRKQRLVPFGEYLPLRNIINLFDGLVNMPIGDLYPAKDVQKPFSLGEHSIGANICYESAYSKIFRQQIPQANWFVNVSNDAWFGGSLAPYQHLEMLRSRAIETGRPMVRSTNTGISAFISDRGEVTQSLDLNKVGVISQNVTAKVGQAPYNRFPAFMMVLSLLILLKALYFKNTGT